MGQIINWQNLDWDNHDGINLAMINDFTRNRFYDNILRDKVQDRDCIDIGFGTGLLSILAVKHGARSVTAVESNYDRYLLGLEIIQRCGLEDRIRLLNLRYQHMMPLYVDNPVFFSETVNGSLWQEGLFNSLPRQTGVEFLPGEYFLEIYCVSCSDSFAAGLMKKSKPSNFFDPGIDVDLNFCKVVNDLRNTCLDIDDISEYHDSISDGFHVLDNTQSTPWGPKPWTRLLEPAQSWHCRYGIDVYNMSCCINDDRGEIIDPIDFNATHITLNIPTNANETLILIPRVGVRHGESVLYLDQGHWGATDSPALVKNKQQVILKHDLSTGAISWHDTETSDVPPISEYQSKL